MKVMYILSSTGEIGGATKSFVNMLDQLKVKGLQAKIILPDTNGLYQTLKKKGYEVGQIDLVFDVHPRLKSLRDLILYIPKILRTKIKNWKSIQYIKNEANIFKPDIIHTNVSPITAGWYAAKSKKIPHVMHIREYGDLDFNLKIYNLKRILSKPYSISITSDIAKHRNVLKKAGHQVIYNGVISEKVIRFNPDKKSYFLYAGRLTKGKGLDSLIESYILYAKQDKNPVELRIFGHAPDIPDKKLVSELKEKLQISGISDFVKWEGSVQNCDDYMYDALATIIPSYFEGFGRVMAEAMFNGCLVVGRDSGGTKEQFDNGFKLTHNEIGLRFKTNEECANHLLNIAKNHENYSQMILRSQQVVKELYTIESNGESVYKFYNEILK